MKNSQAFACLEDFIGRKIATVHAIYDLDHMHARPQSRILHQHRDSSRFGHAKEREQQETIALRKADEDGMSFKFRKVLNASTWDLAMGLSNSAEAGRSPEV